MQFNQMHTKSKLNKEDASFPPDNKVETSVSMDKIPDVTISCEDSKKYADKNQINLAYKLRKLRKGYYELAKTYYSNNAYICKFCNF